MALSEVVQQEVDHWLTKFPADKRRSAVIAGLLKAQAENQGWLKQESIDSLADYLEIPRIEAYEVATFYDMFELEPIGRHKIGICTNVSCMLRGSSEVVAAVEQRLAIRMGETSQDKQFTLRETECLGACVNAPVCQHNDGDYHENLTLDSMLSLIEQWQQES